MTDEPYRVRYTRTARKALADDLPPRVVHAVLALLDGDLAKEPTRVGGPLRPPLKLATWSARRGTYRVLYEIDQDERAVTVVAEFSTVPTRTGDADSIAQAGWERRNWPKCGTVNAIRPRSEL